MVGTFYCSPSLDEAPFATEEAKVATLCLVEVMKLYTTIETTVVGVIESVLSEDGNIIGFDQPLFVIRNHDA